MKGLVCGRYKLLCSGVETVNVVRVVPSQRSLRCSVMECVCALARVGCLVSVGRTW